jgi:hypothetical protein
VIVQELHGHKKEKWNELLVSCVKVRGPPSCHKTNLSSSFLLSVFLGDFGGGERQGNALPQSWNEFHNF